jgi:hypothetical protein
MRKFNCSFTPPPSSGLLYLLYPTTNETIPCRGNLGPKTYLVFAGWMAGCITLTYLYLPETKGRTPAELDAMFEARVPARKFKGKCF